MPFMNVRWYVMKRTMLMMEMLYQHFHLLVEYEIAEILQ